MSIIKQFDLTGKVAIVTGSSKGIGRAIALAFAQQGAKVVLSSRRQEAVDAVAEEFKAAGLDAIAIACHMGSSEQFAQLVDKTVAQLGGLDIVVNNAAANPIFGPIQDADGGAFDKIMQVNVKGPWELCKLAFPHLKNNKGCVINISSIEGVTPGQGMGLYSVSKAALIQLTNSMAREWGPYGIRANSILPGLIQTKFSQALFVNDKILKTVLAKQALPQVGQSDDIAGLALFLASDAASFCTGESFTADGGYTI